MAAFTLSGSDFFDDMMSRFCIISSGNNSVQGFHQDFNLLGPGAVLYCICNKKAGNLTL